MAEEYRITDEQMKSMDDKVKTIEERREGLDEAMRQARRAVSDKVGDEGEKVNLNRFLDGFEDIARDGIETTEDLRKAMEWTYEGDKLECLLLSLTSLAVVAQSMEACKGLSEQYGLLRKALEKDHGASLVKLGLCSMHAKQALELYMTEVMNTVRDICEDIDGEDEDDEEDGE